ncbi:hypothetical protein D3C86_1129580 [compost metagenome]
MQTENDPWAHLRLSDGGLHSSSFLRPDLILHVHDLWANGRHDWKVHRYFSLPDCQKIQPFVFFGVQHCMDFLQNWCLTETDLSALRALPSLSALPQAFWDYLKGIPSLSCTISALREGTRFGDKPIKVSETVPRKSDSETVPFPLMQVTGSAAHVALISEAMGTVLDFCLDYSKMLTRRHLRGGVRQIGRSERENHPLWAMFATRMEIVMTKQEDLDMKNLWLWCDSERDSDAVATATALGRQLQLRGESVMLLIRGDIS